MESTAVADALDAVAASVAALSGLIKGAPPAGVAPSDHLRQLADDCLDGLTVASRLEAGTAALKVQLAATLVEATKAMESPSASPQERCATDMALVAEVACVLTVSERTAGAFLLEARQLSTALPLTLASLQAGTISWQHARILVDETTGLDRAATAGLEAHFLDPDAENPARGCPAGELVPSRFRAKARTWRERHHTLSIEKRHQARARDRRLEFTPDRDGMAWLSAYLPADTAASIWNRATAAARALQCPDESRNLSQRRADTAANWLIAGVAEGVPSPKAQVLVTVPALSLLGATEEPAMLDGYGPIPPSMARQLVADGASSFHRVLTDPATGAPLEIGRSSYRVPNALRQWLRLRDGRCPFPGCNNQSLDNEADHALAWHEGGTTGVSNLSQPCRKHHRLKHTTGWQPMDASRDAPPGWMAPSGRHYTSEGQDWEPAWQPDATLRPPHDAPAPPDVGAYLPDAPDMPDVDAYLPDAPDMPDVGAYLPDSALVDPLPDWEMWLAA